MNGVYMGIFQIFLIIAVLIGMGLILFSFFTYENNSQPNATNYIEVDNTIKALDASINEADSAAEELDKMAKSVFEEFDGKYQELLFLYTLIDEKKRDITESYRKNPSESTIKTDVTIDEAYQIQNPKHEQIYDLQKQGYTVTEIAKNLNMGQGEVKLIMEMGKAR